MKNKQLIFLIAEEKAGRLDAYLARILPDFSRSHLQKLIKQGAVLLDNLPARASQGLDGGEQIRISLPPREEISLSPQDIPLDILYEDEDILVINKARGMVVHPAAGHYQGTLVNAILHHCPNLSGINGVARPGIVHRLDKDTSGILVVAKNDAAHLELSRSWQKHDIERIYQGLLIGQIKENTGTIDAPVGRHPQQRKKMAVRPEHGRPAITHYQVLERFSDHSLTQLRLETGRTHQIRVHMSYLGHPVLGDPLYGGQREKLKP
jgi:23S rRNA pseudouridine1911/1915/1917 synthase